MIQEQNPEMVLCDCMTPKMDGLELCRRVKQDPDTAGKYFIFLTSKAQKVALGILERLGHRADVVADGLEVIKALESISYDLVLMDG